MQTSDGVAVDTISQVLTGADGSIRLVIVTSPAGETTRLVPTTLTMDGNAVVTTSTTIGG